MTKVAFVVPWYGEKITGGAETACRDIISHLLLANLVIEVLTTCVKEFASDWNENYYKEGLSYADNLPIRRFKVRKRDTGSFDKVNYKLINNMYIDESEEKVFFQEMINSPALYDYIRDNSEKYEAFIYIPYMFGTTYFGIKACPEKSILIPCLHEESYAHLSKIKEIFEISNKIIFLAQAEKELAESLYNIKETKREVIGTGVDTEAFGRGDAFQEKYHINSAFLLYAGRKDVGKNVEVLIDYFQKYITRNTCQLKLVLIGGGKIDIATSYKDRIIDLGFISNEDKYDAYSAALALCQPSPHESFSIVIMESWVCGTPVLVNEKCEVTKRFCQISNGGLYYKGYLEFEGSVNYYLTNVVITKKIGNQGKKFVTNNYNWSVVTEKYVDFISNQ